MSVLSYFRAFFRARPGVVALSLSLWLAQSLAELAPGLIVKRFFDALQQQAFAQAERSVLLLVVFAAGFAGIARTGTMPRVPFAVPTSAPVAAVRRRPPTGSTLWLAPNRFSGICRSKTCGCGAEQAWAGPLGMRRSCTLARWWR